MNNLLILHGALGASAQLQPLAHELQKDFMVHMPDFSGHGGQPFHSDGFSIKIFADDIVQYMDRCALDKVPIFGYSMGGYVGMYMARHYPQRVDKLVTLATKYHWDAATAAREIQMLIPEKIEQKIPAFAEVLRNRHAPNDWKEVLKKTADMMAELGNDNTLKPDDYAAVMHPVLVLLGDGDKMITLEETVAVYKSLPNSRMGMLPGTAHPIEQVDPALLGYLIRKFLL